MDVAVAYETDWTIWSIVIVAGVVVAALVWAAFAQPIAEWALDGEHYWPHWIDVVALILYGIISLATTLALMIVPGMIMRHQEHQASNWWVALGCAIAVAALFAWQSYQRWSIWWAAVPAGAIALGLLIGYLNDAFTRFAASIPMPVGLLALAIIIVAIVVVANARTRR